MRLICLSLAVSLALIAAFALAGGADGQAKVGASVEVGCFGDWCSGRDPLRTGCFADAETVASDTLPGSSGQVRVDLRWSPRCQTNWARSTVPYPLWIRAVQPSTGYQQIGGWTNGINSWSPMIYSPQRCVYAEVLLPDSLGALKTWCR